LEKVDKERSETLKRMEDLAGAAQVTAEEIAQAKLKTLDDILADDEKPKELYIKTLGFKIRYNELLVSEWPEVDALRQKDPFEYQIQVLYRMWRRGDSTVTVEKIKNLGLPKATAILLELGAAAILPLSRLVASKKLSELTGAAQEPGSAEQSTSSAKSTATLSEKSGE